MTGSSGAGRFLQDWQRRLLSSAFRLRFVGHKNGQKSQNAPLVESATKGPVQNGPFWKVMAVRRLYAVGLSPSLFSRNLSTLMAQIPAGSCASIVGDASTAADLRACKVGGCCGKDTPLLNLEAVRSRMHALPRWSISEDNKAISTKFVARDWYEFGSSERAPAASANRITGKHMPLSLRAHTRALTHACLGPASSL